IRCYYANPYTIGSIWKCDGLKQNVQYVMDVYDLQGRVRLNVPIPEDGTFRIMGRLDEGMHLMTIRGGLDIHTEKVLIAH
ncbi:MAG TPA: T9SS type A sorting domain-containing protein, partial [Cryomorphaceae bacterium]|nr:T9SS type A sorting domain-containing protein [Cryomorphaceae bacterium]